MAWRAEHHQLILDPGLYLDICVLAFAFDQTQVNFVLGHLLYNVRRVLHMQADSALRVTLHKCTDQQGGQVVADSQGGTDGQGAETAFAV